MQYKLIASDMDGTLVNSGSKLSERTKRAVKNAVDAGYIFVTATGRPFCNVHIVNDLFDEDMPFIVFNGSAAYMGKSEKLLFEKFLGFGLAREAFTLGQEFGMAQIVWTGARLWANKECKETIQYRDFSTIPDMTAAPDFDIIESAVNGISKVLWIAEPDIIKVKQQQMSMHFKDRLNCYSSLPYFLEFVGIDASKGDALARVGEIYGIDRSEMIAVGDAYNDISMLEYAGLSVAVANAPDDIKILCDHITGSNDDDGVAAVIEEFLLINN